MKQTVMLKKNYEFKIVLTKGRFYIGKQLKIVILKNGKNFMEPEGSGGAT